MKCSQVAEKTRCSLPSSSKLVYPRYDLGWDGIFSHGCGCLWREFRSNRNFLLFGLKQTESMVNNTLHDQGLCLLFNWIMCSKSGRTSNHFSWLLQIFILFPKEQSVPSSEAICVILGMHCFTNVNAFSFPLNWFVWKKVRQSRAQIHVLPLNSCVSFNFYTCNGDNNTYPREL